MEEILIVILQGIFEFLLELLFYGGADLLAFGRRDEEPGGCGWLVLFVILGALIGGLANLVHPRSFLPLPWLRLVNLIAGPLLGGGIAWAWTDHRRRRGRRLDPWKHFWLAFGFLLAFDLVRFLYAQH